MIAVISSTIFPPARSAFGVARSALSDEERCAQTLDSVESLRGVGISRIFLADNSGPRWREGTEARFPGVEIRRSTPFQLNNKGLNELYMLLDLVDELPAGEPILKLSGRYRLLVDRPPELGTADFAIRVAASPAGRAAVPTSCYLARDRELLRRFLEETIYEQYAYYARAVNVRTLARLFVNSLAPRARRFQFADPPDPIEFAAARVLLSGRYSIERIAEPISYGVAGMQADQVHVH